MLAMSLLVAVLLVASFFVGAFYTSFGAIERYGRIEFVQLPSRTISGATTDELPKTVEYNQVPVTVPERMVIYNGYISLETDDIQGNIAKIRSLAESYDGYVAGSSHSENYAEIMIRVPKDEFQRAIKEIETFGKVLEERTSSDDVTEQYVDLKARLENSLRQEKRLSEILQMAKTVDEVLNVERELERVRGEIESLQGEINYLERNVAMAIITIYLSEPPPPFTPPGMDWKETFETALRGLFAVFRGLIIIVVSLLPLLVVGVPMYYVYRKRKSKKQSAM